MCTIEMYTEDSKDGRNKAAVAAVGLVNDDIFSARLPDEAAIFTADAKAIEFAVECIRISKNTHFTIFSDSLSLQSLHNMNIDHPFISRILYNYRQVVEKSKKSISDRVPSHIGIHGNNKEDRCKIRISDRSSKIQIHVFLIQI